MIVVGYYGFTKVVRVSIRLSIGSDKCILVVSPSVSLSVVCPSVFLIPDDNLSEWQWNFTKLCMCIGVVEIWVGKFCQFLTEKSAIDRSIFLFFWTKTSVNINGFSPNLILCALVLWRSCLGLLMDKFCQFLTELSVHDTSIFLFQDITWVNLNGFSTILLCALTLWRSGLGLLLHSNR